MRTSAVTIEALDANSDAASIEAGRALLLEYGRFVLDAEGSARFCFGKLQEEVDGLPCGFTALHGECLLAWVGGVAAGCVTYRALPTVAGGCEMKRLWVRREFRGMELGDRLISELCQRAHAAGYAAVYLDTMPASMGAAYRMYERLGFTPCVPYHSGTADGLVFMRRPLP